MPTITAKKNFNTRNDNIWRLSSCFFWGVGGGGVGGWGDDWGGWEVWELKSIVDFCSEFSQILRKSAAIRFRFKTFLKYFFYQED